MAYLFLEFPWPFFVQERRLVHVSEECHVRRGRHTPGGPVLMTPPGVYPCHHYHRRQQQPRLHAHRVSVWSASAHVSKWPDELFLLCLSSILLTGSSKLTLQKEIVQDGSFYLCLKQEDIVTHCKLCIDVSEACKLTSYY